MAFITLQETTLTPRWQWGGSSAYLYIWASQPFYEYVTGQYIASGQVGNTQSFCQKITCTVSGTSITIPQVTLATTIDSSVPNATYTAVLYDSSNRKRYTLLSQFFVDPDYLQDPAEAWLTVSNGGTGSSTGVYEYSGQHNGNAYYNLEGEAVSTANNAVVYTGTQWNITNGAGAILYYNTDDTDFPWSVVSAWVNDAGALPVPVVAEYDAYQTTTWEALTISQQGFATPGLPFQYPGPFWNVYQTRQYFEDTYGGSEVPYAAELRAGKVRLNADPAVETIPIAVGTNSGDWIAITTDVIWLSGEEYDNNFADAVTGIGATPKTLIITESTNVTATVSTPTTLHLQFESGGKLNVSSGQTVTIGSMNPCGSQQIFTGAGNVVFAKNATNGKFELSWWAGISNAGDCTRSFTQAATSLTNNTGGELHIGPGVWKMDGMTVPSGSWIVGSGNHTDSTSGTVIKPFSTSAVDLFTFSSGVTRAGLKNLTTTTTGTASSSSKPLRILGSATTIFGLTFDEVHFEAALASSILVTFDDVASNNHEIVDVLFNHCIWEVPANGTAIKWESNNTTTLMVQPSIICAAGAKCFHVGQAGGGGGWIRCIGGDFRGPGSFVSAQTSDRAVNGSIDGGTGVMTLVSGAFVQNDVGQPFTHSLADGYIKGLLTSTTATTSYSGVNVAADDIDMERYVPSTSAAYCVWHIVGDHNTISCDGDADEGFQYFLINDAPTNVSPISFNGMTIQSRVLINANCVLVFNNCALRSGFIYDATGITGSVFFNGCSWDKNTTNVITGLTTPELTLPRWQGVIEGATRCYPDTSFHEGIQQQFFETRANFYDRNDGGTTPIAVFASASEATDQPAIRIGKLDPYTWDVSLYYDFYRDTDVDGWLQIEGSQAAPNKGIATNCNIQTVAGTIIGGVVSPAQITAHQHNYNPGNSSYLVRLTANGNYDITGIGLTTTQRGGERHEYVLLDNRVITWKNQSASSSAANRFQTDTNADILQAQYERVFITYDATTQRWRVSKPNITGLTSNGTTLNVALLLAGTSADFSGNLGVTGTTTLENALEVNGTTQLDDAVAINAELTVSGGAVNIVDGEDLVFLGATGTSKIRIPDNLASALAIAEGGTDYLLFKTTNSSEAIHALKPLLQISPTAGIGYGTGAGGTVAQGSASGKATPVTLNKITGSIQMDNANLPAGDAVTFTLTNSAISANDILVMNYTPETTDGAYVLNAVCSGGTADITVTNITAGGLAEVVTIQYAVIKAVSS